jgi:hypothetical protein
MAADTYMRHCRATPNGPDGSGGAMFIGPFTSLMVEGGS